MDASPVIADAQRQRGAKSAEDLDPLVRRAVAEYLATLDDAAFGAATPVEPKIVSPVDPATRWTASWGGPAVFAYCTDYLVDEATDARGRAAPSGRSIAPRQDGHFRPENAPESFRATK